MAGFALLSQECEFVLPMCLQRETGIEKGSVSNCLLETLGKSGSQNVWESHQASSVRAQLPGIAAWDQWCNKAVMFSTTSSSHQTLWRYPELLLVQFCFWSWGTGQAGLELKVGKEDQRQIIQPAHCSKEQWSSGDPSLLFICNLHWKSSNNKKIILKRLLLTRLMKHWLQIKFYQVIQQITQHLKNLILIAADNMYLLCSKTKMTWENTGF